MPDSKKLSREANLPLQVTHFQRYQAVNRYSVEGYFDRVRDHLGETITARKHSLKFLSRGFLRRLFNMLEARFQRSDINHITGDVHFLALALPPQQTILTVLDCQVLERLTGWKHWIIKTFWYTLPIRRTKYITAISEETKRQVLALVDIPEDRITVIPVSISPLFRPCPREFNSVKPTILQVGTKANKNLPRVAAALEGISCQLEIVGPLSPSDTAVLDQHCVSYRSHTGLSDEDVMQLYHDSDLVCFASTHEGFGMPIVEAQTMERICITSNCSSMPEVAGQGAVFVDPFNIASIRDGVLRVQNDAELRQKVISAGRINRQRFQPEQIGAAFRQLYERVGHEQT